MTRMDTNREMENARRSAFCGARSAFLVLLLLPGSVVAATNATGPVWPPPPDEPRVAYVRSIARPADIGIKPAALSRLARWITGTGPGEQEFVRPFGLSLDEAGNLLLTDTGLNEAFCLDRVRKKWFHWQAVGKTRFASPVAISSMLAARVLPAPSIKCSRTSAGNWVSRCAPRPDK